MSDLNACGSLLLLEKHLHDVGAQYDEPVRQGIMSFLHEVSDARESKSKQSERARELYLKIFNLLQTYADGFTSRTKVVLTHALYEVGDIQVSKTIRLASTIQEVALRVLQFAFLIVRRYPFDFPDAQSIVEGAMNQVESLTIEGVSVSQFYDIHRYGSEFFLETQNRLPPRLRIALFSLIRESCIRVVNRLKDGSSVNLVFHWQYLFRCWEVFLQTNCPVFDETMVKAAGSKEILGFTRIVSDLLADFEACEFFNMWSHCAESISAIYFYLDTLERVLRRAANLEARRIHRRLVEQLAHIAQRIDMVTLGKITRAELLSKKADDFTALRLRSIEARFFSFDLYSRSRQSAILSAGIDLVLQCLNLYLFERGISWKPCPSAAGVTTVHLPNSLDSPFQLLMEEALWSGNLDVASRCVNEGVPAEELNGWRLFAVRFYLEKFLSNQQAIFNKSFVESAEKAHSLVVFTSLSCKVPNEVSSSLKILKEKSGYSAVAENSQNIKEAIPCIKSMKTYLLTACQQLFEHVDLLNAEVLPMFVGYETGVATLLQHAKALKGFASMASLPKKLSLGAKFHAIDPSRCNNRFGEELLPILMNGLLLQGEEGIARALCEYIAPGDREFLDLFLRDMQLAFPQDAPEDEERVEDISPWVNEKSVAPQPARTMRKNPQKHHAIVKKKRASRAQKRQEELPVPNPSPERAVEELTTQLSAIHIQQPLVMRKSEHEIPSLPSIDFQRIVNQFPKIEWHPRVRLWKTVWYKNSCSLLEYVCHTHPSIVAMVTHTIGQESLWRSLQTGNIYKRVTCIGTVELYRQRMPPVLGFFSEGYGIQTPNTLVHHCFHPRTEENFFRNGEANISLFGVGQQKDSRRLTPYEKGVLERLRTKKLFDPLEQAKKCTVSCCNRIFTLKQTGATVQVVDELAGIIYTLVGKDCELTTFNRC